MPSVTFRKLPDLVSQSNVNHVGGSAPARYGEARALAMQARHPSRPCSRSLLPSVLLRAGLSLLGTFHPTAAAASLKIAKASETGWRGGSDAIASLGESSEGVRSSSIGGTIFAPFRNSSASLDFRGILGFRTGFLSRSACLRFSSRRSAARASASSSATSATNAAGVPASIRRRSKSALTNRTR